MAYLRRRAVRQDFIGFAIGLGCLWVGMAAHSAPGRVFTDCGVDCPDMVVVPAGAIEIGSTPEERLRAGIPDVFGFREGPPLRVTLARPFALARTEVTRGHYAVFVADTERPDPVNCVAPDTTTFAWTPHDGLSWRDPGYAQTDSHPAVCISYDDATAYAAWLAAKTGQPYRLPSEAEWEYAARAGTRTAWYWGDSIESGCDKANIISTGEVAAMGSPPYWKDKIACQDPRANSMPVGSFAPNAFGLNDMIGNAFEWVADCASDSHDGQPVDGSARQRPDCQRRFLKGGGFHTPTWLTRAAVRSLPLPSTTRMVPIGFRVARDLAE